MGTDNLSYANALYAEMLQLGLNIDISRGIPSLGQLEISQALIDAPLDPPYASIDGTDPRNYGGQAGLRETRELFAPVLGVPCEQIVASGNSSLALMYDCMALAVRKGTPDSDCPWSMVPGQAAILCPTPGYDRHFAIAEELGLKLIPVPLDDRGPDMRIVRERVSSDPSIKAMWCVPKYSNPTGTVYADEVVHEIATMPTASKDFRVFWDNAYCLHSLTPCGHELANIHQACEASGNPDRAISFASTSKITLPGAGIGFMASSPRNIAWWLRAASIRSVGPDKLNQLRQVRFLRNLDHMRLLMERHRQLLKPKFDLADEVLRHVLEGRSQARWTRPEGGYFISLSLARGTARRTVELASRAGVTFATPGGCFPYRHDPNDAHLRLAPSHAVIEQLGPALKVIAASMLKAELELAA